MDSVGIGYAIAAIGALGTAAFGLVDGLKTLPRGGISNAGFGFISASLGRFFEGKPNQASAGQLPTLLDTLHGNWINGTVLADQKAIAKSLIKLRLNAGSAPAFAKATQVDSDALVSVGEKVAKGEQLTDADTNVLGRFDLALTAIVDAAYQHADQKYRNAAKLAAMAIAVLLALAGGVVTFQESSQWWTDMAKALFAGLIATPLAPISKDVASAITAAANAAQALRR